MAARARMRRLPLQFLDRLLKALVQAVGKHIDRELDAADVLQLDSSTSHKLSKHWIVQ